MLNLLGFGEHSGNGVPDIFSVWEQAGLAEPVIEEHFGEDGPNKTVVILPLVLKNQALFEKRPEKGPEKGPEKRPHRKADDIEKRIMQVYELIAINPSISRPEIGQQLNISLKQTRIAVDALKERGIIHREGSARKGLWVIDKEL